MKVKSRVNQIGITKGNIYEVTHKCQVPGYYIVKDDQGDDNFIYFEHAVRAPSDGVIATSAVVFVVAVLGVLFL